MSKQLITLEQLKSAVQRPKELNTELAVATTEALEEMADLITELQEKNESLKEKVNNMVPVCGGFIESSS